MKSTRFAPILGSAPRRAAPREREDTGLTDLQLAGAKPSRARARTKTPRGSKSDPTSPPAQPAVDPVAALVTTLLAALDDGKAEDVVTLDLIGKTSLADAMVVASGRSSTQVAALAERVAQALKATGRAAPAVEGLPQADWVLIDAGDVIVHVFRPEVRQFYNLEKMWGGDRPSEPRPAARAAAPRSA